MKIDRLSEFLDEVKLKTQQGAIPWKGTAEDDIFSAVVGGGRYILKAFGFTEYVGEGRSEGPPTLAIFTKENKIIIDITGDLPGSSQNLLDEIYTLARGKAIGVDEAIETILKTLGDLPL